MAPKRKKYDVANFVRLFFLGFREEDMKTTLDMPERTFYSHQSKLCERGTMVERKRTGRPKVGPDRRIRNY